MEPENPQNLPPPEVPLYSIPNIALASFLGGPLAAGWLISVNFRRLNEPKAARNALVQGVLATLALVGLMIGLPAAWIEYAPGLTVPLVYTGLIWFLAERLQGEILAQHFARGGNRHSAWRSVGVSLVAALPVAVVLLGVALVVPMAPPYDFEGEPVHLEESGDIIYSTDAIPIEDAETIGLILSEEGVFVDDRIDVAGIRVVGGMTHLDIPVPLDSWSDLGILSGLRRANIRLEEAFPFRSIELFLVHQGVSGIQRRPFEPEDGVTPEG